MTGRMPEDKFVTCHAEDRPVGDLDYSASRQELFGHVQICQHYSPHPKFYVRHHALKNTNETNPNDSGVAVYKVVDNDEWIPRFVDGVVAYSKRQGCLAVARRVGMAHGHGFDDRGHQVESRYRETL